MLLPLAATLALLSTLVAALPPHAVQLALGSSSPSHQRPDVGRGEYRMDPVRGRSLRSLQSTS